MKKDSLLFLLLSCFLSLNAQKHQLGTEIWIEPGFTQAEIFNLAKITSDAGMKDVRIFLMWTHVEPKPDEWDFDIYDWMFKACEKYNLKLQVTLNANHPAWYYGYEYYSSIHTHAIFTTEEMKIPAEKYIRKVVERYKDSEALDYWWLMNEPYPMDKETPYILEGFHTAMKNKYQYIEKLNKLWNTGFTSFDEIKDVSRIYNAEWAAAIPYYDWKQYCNQHLTEFQRWVRDVVLKYDDKHPFTTNPGAYLSLYHRQDASEWKPFIDAFGLSIHPTWHFEMFSQNQYSMAVAATCELGRSVADYNPFWISELSIGNSMYHLCPGANEVAQWTWVGIAQGAKKTIYWCLNQRPVGNESGEWAMLDFQGEPTSRMEKAIEIGKILEEETDFFKQAKPLESKISILLSQETCLSFNRKGYGDIHNEAAMACYQALSERGIAVKLEQTRDFDWANSKGKAIIMPEVYTIPSLMIDSVKTFLHNGNKMIVLGSFGYFNEYEKCQYLDFPFKYEFGAEPEDVQSLTDHFQISLNENSSFEVYKILGTLETNNAKVLMKKGEYVTGIRNQFENSEIVWIPSGVGAGAWRYGNETLSEFLSDELYEFYIKQPFRFKSKSDHIGMQTMSNEDRIMTVINNGLDTINTLKLESALKRKARILYSTNRERKELDITKDIFLSPRECLVLLWE